MSHPVIPAPLRFEAAGEREFAFRPGTTVTYADYGLAPMAERFCAQVTRRGRAPGAEGGPPGTG